MQPARRFKAMLMVLPPETAFCLGASLYVLIFMMMPDQLYLSAQQTISAAVEKGIEMGLVSSVSLALLSLRASARLHVLLAALLGYGGMLWFDAFLFEEAFFWYATLAFVVYTGLTLCVYDIIATWMNKGKACDDVPPPKED